MSKCCFHINKYLPKDQKPISRSLFQKYFSQLTRERTEFFSYRIRSQSSQQSTRTTGQLTYDFYNHFLFYKFKPKTGLRITKGHDRVSVLNITFSILFPPMLPTPSKSERTRRKRKAVLLFQQPFNNSKRYWNSVKGQGKIVIPESITICKATTNKREDKLCKTYFRKNILIHGIFLRNSPVHNSFPLISQFFP